MSRSPSQKITLFFCFGIHSNQNDNKWTEASLDGLAFAMRSVDESVDDDRVLIAFIDYGTMFTPRQKHSLLLKTDAISQTEIVAVRMPLGD